MSNIFSVFGFQRRELSKPAATDESKPQSGATAQGGSFGQQAVQVHDANSALKIAPWYRAGEVLAKTMAQLVLEYQKQNDARHGGNYEPYLRNEGRHLNYLFQLRPNPMMTAEQWLSQMTLARFHEGNAVSYIERDLATDDVRNIWMCTSASLMQTAAGLMYTVTYNTPTGIVSKTGVGAEDVIHWRNTFSNDGGLTGVSNLHYAEQALSIAATNDRQAKDIAAKGGKMKLLLTEDTSNVKVGLSKNLTKDQKNRQRDDLQNALNEGKDVLLMSGLMDVKPISQDATQMQLLQNRQHDTKVVAQFTGVPLVLLMDYTNNTYKAPEQAMQAFLQHTICPMARSLEMEITSKLVGENAFPTLCCRFNEDSLMRLDPLGRATLAEKLLQTGIKCVDELRHDFGLPQLEGGIGKRHLVSANLQPLDDLRVIGSNTSTPNT